MVGTVCQFAKIASVTMLGSASEQQVVYVNLLLRNSVDSQPFLFLGWVLFKRNGIMDYSEGKRADPQGNSCL